MHGWYKSPKISFEHRQEACNVETVNPQSSDFAEREEVWKVNFESLGGETRSDVNDKLSGETQQPTLAGY